MKNHLAQILIVSLIFITSCRKDEEVPIQNPPDEECDTTFIYSESLDTLFPPDIFPAYPGSWWSYSDGSVDSVTTWVNLSTYQNSSNGNCVTIDEHLVLAIAFNENAFAGQFPQYFRGNEKIYQPPFMLDGRFDKMFDPNFYEWELYSIDHGFMYPNGQEVTYYREHFAHLDSLEVSGTMYYEVEHYKNRIHTDYYHYGVTKNVYTHYYYAKDIGVIRKEYEDEVGTISNFEYLTNYYIAPH